MSLSVPWHRGIDTSAARPCVNVATDCITIAARSRQPVRNLLIFTSMAGPRISSRSTAHGQDGVADHAVHRLRTWGVRQRKRSTSQVLDAPHDGQRQPCSSASSRRRRPSAPLRVARSGARRTQRASASTARCSGTPARLPNPAFRRAPHGIPHDGTGDVTSATWRGRGAAVCEKPALPLGDLIT